MKNLAILASGSGSNAEVIIRYFRNHETIRIVLVISNKVEAGVLEKAKRLGIPSMVIPKKCWQEETDILKTFKNQQIDGIILAGFLLQVPPFLIERYSKRIINIHPALLPKFGGKGMYGKQVHQAVKLAGESNTGITIHEVNEVYDDGEIIFQASCSILPTDDVETIALKVQELEHIHYPKVIEGHFKTI